MLLEIYMWQLADFLAERKKSFGRFERYLFHKENILACIIFWKLKLLKSLTIPHLLAVAMHVSA